MAQLLIDRPELMLAPEGLSADEETRLRTAVGKLTAALARAVWERHASAAVGAVHESPARAIADTLATLASLDGLCHEVSYVAATDDERPDLNVEGVFTEPVELGACVEIVPQELVGTLVDFFHGNRLVSLTIRRDAPAAQLTAFVEIAAARLPGTPGAPTERLGEALVARGVLAISTIDRDETIPAKLGLSWAGRLALSRVGKILSDVPTYVRASGRDQRQIWAALLRETIHPLRADHLLAEFVLNADLALTSGADLERADLQGDVVAVLTTHEVCRIASFLVRQLAGPQGGNVDFAWRSRDVTLLRRLFPRMAELLDQDMVGVLRAAVAHGLLAADELPANLRDALDIDKLTSAFLANPEPLLSRLRGVHDLESWRQFGSSFVAITSDLMRRRHYGWANQIAAVLAGLAHPAGAASPRVRQLAAKARAANATAANLEHMAAHLPQLSSEERAHLLALLGHFGVQAAYLLIRRLDDNRDDSLRASLRSMLASLGKTALPLLTHALLGKHQRPERLHDLLLALGAMRDPTLYEHAAAFLAAEHPRVRQAALQAVARMDPTRAAPELASALADPSLPVRATAVEGLGTVGSRDAAFLSFLAELFAGGMQPQVGHKQAPREVATTVSAYYQLLTSGCAAVASLAKRGGTDLAKLEPSLARSLKKIDGSLVGVAARALGRGPELDKIEEQRHGAALALVTALAWIGTESSLSVLRDACAYPDPRVARLAVRAIEEITARVRR